MEDSHAHLPHRRRKSHLESATIQSFLRILSFCSGDSIASCPVLPDVVKPDTVLNSNSALVNPFSNQSQKNEFIDSGHLEVVNPSDAQEWNMDGNSKSIEDESGISRKRDSTKGAVDLDKVGSNRLSIEEDSIREGSRSSTHIRNGIYCDGESGQIVQVEGGNEFAPRNVAESEKWSAEEARVAGQPFHHCVVEQDSNLGVVLESNHVQEQLRTEEVCHEVQEVVKNESKSVNSIQFTAENEAFPSEQLFVDELGHHHMPPRGQGLDSAGSSDPIVSSINSIGHQDMEEGEIPDDFGFLDQLQDSALEDCCRDFDNRVVEEVLVSNGLVAQSGLAQTTTGQSAIDRKNMASGYSLTSGFNFRGNCTDAKLDARKVTRKGDEDNTSANCKTNEARQSFSVGHVQALGQMLEANKTDIVCSKEGIPSGLGPIREIPGHLGTESAEKDNKARKEKKRAPLSEERKAKKKASKKRKRAQLKREQGVKRLKLMPFTKPKVVRDCKFYLKGRCQQGEECKFSHSGVPLTKSKPCSHFALGTCLKGEECPYDHQLSKYPCTNYNLKGMCRRGEACLFSHEKPLSEGFSLALKFKSDESMLPPDKTKAPGPVTINDTNHKYLNHLFENSTQAESFTSQRYLQNSPKDPKAETQPKLPAKAPEGIRILSIGKAPLHDSSKQLQSMSSPSDVNDNKTSDSCKQTTAEKPCNKNEMPSSSLPCNKNEMPSRTQQSAFSSKPPAGIQFFSLGKSSLDDTSRQLQIKNSPSDVNYNNETMNRHMQTSAEKPCNSNETRCKPQASPISSCPSSKSSVDVCQSLQNSSLKAPCSLLTLAQKDGSDLTSHFFQASSSTSRTKNVSGSVTSSSFSGRMVPTQPPNSSQGEMNDASRILEEFLFSGLSQ